MTENNELIREIKNLRTEIIMNLFDLNYKELEIIQERMNNLHMGLSNDEKPFEPGDKIEWDNQFVYVIENFGQTGTVKYEMESERVYTWEWNCDGIISRRVSH
jgi:hypothetical protein